jgi:hypothetical protein
LFFEAKLRFALFASLTNFWKKRREAMLRVKTAQILVFDAKLRFTLFPSLRSAIFMEFQEYS